MSWFDATGLTSLAKSALKEAQKTIDKALDIQQEENEQTSTTKKQKSLPESSPSQPENDFFSSWGLTSSNSLNTIADKDAPIITQSPSKVMTHSLWGSFTGSFFENESDEKGNVRKVPNKMLISEKGKPIDPKLLSDLETTTSFKNLPESHDKTYKNNTKNNTTDVHPVVMRKSSDRQSSALNRLSIISVESSKNSSESIEVLGSQSMKTTPDSEVTSLNNSVSSNSLGLKLASSSVEVIADSPMTPSSIELLGYTHTASDEEFGSPLTSPAENEKSFRSEVIPVILNTVEQIQTISHLNVANEEEEISAADDTISYNSISEFTAPTILDGSNVLKSVDTQTTKKQNPPFSNEMIGSFGSDMAGSVLHSGEDLPITRAPVRCTTQFSSANQCFDSKEFSDKLNFQSLSDSNVINCDNVIQPSGDDSFPSLITDSFGSSTEGSWSDRTINPDSDGVGLESSFDNITKKALISDRVTSSCSVKGILDDALIDKLSESSSFCKLNDNSDKTWKEGALSSSSHSYEEVDKDSSIDNLTNESIPNMEFRRTEPTSPVSSDGRSVDIVKIGSEQTSGHTSGDDLETTTSSDIEIIPSPNGDYGNTYMIRQSPGKVGGKMPKHNSGNVVDLVLGKALATKIRGHTRELSGASNQSNTSDDSHGSEVDRLMKKLAEMTEILESREAKLIEISRNNIELNDSNAELKLQLENYNKQDATDVTLITEEYTQRLSALEKKFQQAIREKDVLRKQTETYKAEAASRVTAGDLENIIGERDVTIKELREEGEKLSKQQLHHSTIIKRLRAKEKENEQVIKTLRDKVADQAQELDRLKRSITAKEAVECSQIESMYKLTATNKKLDTELSETKGQLDDTLQKFETVKRSFEGVKKEITELQKNCGDQAKNLEYLETLEKDKASIELENEKLMHQLEDLRNKMRQDEQKWMHREAALRNEVSRQMARAEEAESSLLMSKNDIGNVCTSDGTTDGRILLAQLAALQESSLERDRRFQATERRLQQSAADAQEKLSKASEANHSLREECKILQEKLSSIEIALSHTNQKLENCKSSCEEHMAQLTITLESSNRLKKEYDEYKQETTQSLEELSEKLKNSDLHLSAELAALEAEKRRNIILQGQLKDATTSIDLNSGSSLLLARLVGTGDTSNINASITMERPGNTSPHGSIGRDSLASESLGSGAWPNDDVESYSGNTGVTITDSIATASDGGMFTLERLQAALQRREGELRAARKAGRRSHAQRTALARELALHAAELDNMQSLQHQYDALLQMYGEKEEQLQELRLDLQDVKDMYKMQLDEILMLKKQASEHKASSK